MAAAIALMCKAPRPGYAKTRLARAIGAEAAAQLAASFIEDSATRAASLAATVGGVAIAFHTPADAGADIAPLLPAGMALAPQCQGDLGQRMAGIAADLFAAGHGPVLITGTDLPTLPEALLHEALLALRDGRAAVGLVPVLDGGYCAIALSAPAPALFQDIAWGTDGVMAATVEAAARLGIALHRTASWYDVDEPADLDTLRRELAGTLPPGCAAARGWPAHATRRALAAQDISRPMMTRMLDKTRGD